MDYVLEYCDEYFFDQMYAKIFPGTICSHLITSPEAFVRNAAVISAVPRENLARQYISLFIVTWIFGTLLYALTAAVSYIFFYNHKLMNHPKFMKNQIPMEIAQALKALPIMAALTVPWFLAEIRGYSLLYAYPSDFGGWGYIVFTFPFFIMFTDALIYLGHRWLHWPRVYKYLHKPHHKWIVPTPFASHAFHPVDGYVQSVPYHLFPFLFPLNKFVYLSLFAFVNFWTVMIHDGEYFCNNPVINGAAHHTEHHLFFNYNYGQFTTLWDRLGKSYRQPSEEYFDAAKKNALSTWKKQINELEKIVAEVEEKDERVYIDDTKKD